MCFGLAFWIMESLNVCFHQCSHSRRHFEFQREPERPALSFESDFYFRLNPWIDIRTNVEKFRTFSDFRIFLVHGTKHPNGTSDLNFFKSRLDMDQEKSICVHFGRFNSSGFKKSIFSESVVGDFFPEIQKNGLKFVRRLRARISIFLGGSGRTFGLNENTGFYPMQFRCVFLFDFN